MAGTDEGISSGPGEPRKFEQLILDVMARFFDMPEGQIDSEIDAAIRRIVEFLGLDQGFLIHWGEDPSRPYPAHSWTAPGGLPVPLTPRIELVPWIHRQSILGNIAMFSRVDDLPQEAEQDKEFFRSSGRTAFISLPVRTDGRVVGVLAFASRSREIEWPEGVVNRLRLAAQVLGSILDRRTKKLELEGRLKFESLMVRVSARLVSLPAYQADPFIQEFLRLLCDSFGLDRCAIWQRTMESPDFLQLTHVHQSINGPPYEMAARLEMLPEYDGFRLSRDEATPGIRINLATLFPWASRKLESGETMVFPRVSDLPEEAAIDKKSWAALGTKSNVTVPLFAGENQFAILTFASMREERHWSEEEVKRFRMVGDLLTNALARHRADMELRHSEMDLRLLAGRLIYAQEEELRRLARELHDDLSQRLALLAIDADCLQQCLADFPSSLRQQLQSIQDQLAEVSQDVHSLSRRLHPSILETLGLAKAILYECRNFTQRGNVVAHFEEKPVPAEIGKEVSLCVYRIVQEGLRNIAKHAHATEAHVSLSVDGGTVCLHIRDDGIGFDPHRITKKAGLGLASMDERVRHLQGTARVDSKPGKGTSIEVRIPLGASPNLETRTPIMSVDSGGNET